MCQDTSELLRAGVRAQLWLCWLSVGMALLIVCWIWASWKRLLHVLLQVSLGRAHGRRSQTSRESTPSTRGAHGKAAAVTLAWPGTWGGRALSVPKTSCSDISVWTVRFTVSPVNLIFSSFFLCRVIRSKHLSWLNSRQGKQLPCAKGSSCQWGVYEGVRSVRKWVSVPVPRKQSFKEDRSGCRTAHSLCWLQAPWNVENLEVTGFGIGIGV